VLTNSTQIPKISFFFGQFYSARMSYVEYWLKKSIRHILIFSTLWNLCFSTDLSCLT